MRPRPETQLWWDQAKRDMSIARHNHERRDYEAAVFFCEQAAQKAIKALLIHRTSKAPPRIHNLIELGRMVGGMDAAMLDFLAELTPHYMMTRYPDAAGVPTYEVYEGHISLKFLRGTGKVLKWCRNRLR